MCSGHQRPAPRAPVGYYWCGPVAQPVGNSPRMCVVTAVGDVLCCVVWCAGPPRVESVLCVVCVGGWACDRHAHKYVRSCPAEACRIACVAMACVQVRLAAYCVRCFGVTVPTGGVCVVSGGSLGGGVCTAARNQNILKKSMLEVWFIARCLSQNYCNAVALADSPSGAGRNRAFTPASSF